MAKLSPRSARAIDIHLGHRLRAARQTQHMSQTNLAAALGITFQQIQKYEKRGNRISAARLFEIAHVLDVPVTYFFEGAKQPQVHRSRRRERSGPPAKPGA